METRWPKRGDIMMGRPLFVDQKATDLLSEKEHPCMVLKVVERKDLPGNPVMAVVIPMTHAKLSATQPNNLEVKPYHTRNMKMDPAQKSYLRTDSPNVIVLNGEDNGVRKAAFAPDWVSPFTHGRITDDALIAAAETLTKAFLKETQYEVPKQGFAPGEARPKLRKRMDVSYEQRKAIVLSAARQEAATQSRGFLRLQHALRQVDVDGSTIPNAKTVPGFRAEGPVLS